MPGPIDSLRFVHAAILNEAAYLDATIGTATTPEEAGVLADRIATFGHLVHGHTSGEEVGLFPRLVEREPSYAETYLFDHEQERQLFVEMEALAEECKRGDTHALAALRRATVALCTHAIAHVNKENELVLPKVAELFSVEEQGQIVADILSTFTPEDTAGAVPWIVSRLDADTAAAYVNVLSGAMPPPVFEMAKGWIRDGVSAEQWSALSERVPALAA